MNFLVPPCEVHIHGVDPVSVLILSCKAQEAFPELDGEQSVIIAHRERVHICLFAAEVGHAPQGEDVADGIVIPISGPGSLGRPSGVNSLCQRSKSIVRAVQVFVPSRILALVLLKLSCTTV